jgi:uncharacterized protein
LLRSLTGFWNEMSNRKTPSMLVDADSHIMESPNFLIDHADAHYRDQMPVILADRGELRERLDGALLKGGHSAEIVRAECASNFSTRRDYLAVGAFNTDERRVVLDRLGISQQILYPTFSSLPAFFGKYEAELRYAMGRSVNRGIAEFSATDKRFIGVGILPVADVDQALAELDFIIASGLGFALVPHVGTDMASFNSRRFEKLWTRMAEANITLAIHTLPAPKMAEAMLQGNNIIPLEMLDGDLAVRDENITEPPETAISFFSRLILDGVFLRHPDLRCAVTELGASWVPGLMQRLDAIASTLTRHSGKISSRMPSQQISDQFIFTPHHFEDVGTLMRNSPPHLYAFSSDYPHVEGGYDAIGSFAASLSGCNEAEREAFFGENFSNFLKC